MLVEGGEVGGWLDDGVLQELLPSALGRQTRQRAPFLADVAPQQSTWLEQPHMAEFWPPWLAAFELCINCSLTVMEELRVPVTVESPQ